MQRMGWTLPFTIGNLHLLWYWALEFAPIGDLTRFEPEQLTYDLDLGGATPEQVVEAMIHAGFIDRSASATPESRPGGKAGFIDRSEDSLRLHNWPDYTAKFLRPKFRRNPERWYQVLRSYGLPVITRRKSRRDTGASAQEQPAPSSAEREPERVEHKPQATALRSVRQMTPTNVASTNDVDESSVALPNGDATPADSASPVGGFSGPSPTAQSRDATSGRPDSTLHGSTGGTAPIPAVLAAQPYFSDAWWPKLLELYKNKGCPMTAFEQGEVLAMLAKQPLSAVSMLKHSVRNFESSFAALPALGGKRLANTS